MSKDKTSSQLVLDHINAALTDLKLQGPERAAVMIGPRRIIFDDQPERVGYVVDFSLLGAREQLFCEVFQRKTGIGILSTATTGTSRTPGVVFSISFPLFQQLTIAEFDGVVEEFKRRDNEKRVHVQAAPAKKDLN